MSFKKQYFFFLRPIVVYIHQRIVITATLLFMLTLLCHEVRGSVTKDSIPDSTIVIKNSTEDQVLLSKTLHDLKVKNILVVSISSFCALIIIFFIIYRLRKQKEILK